MQRSRESDEKSEAEKKLIAEANLLANQVMYESRACLLEMKLDVSVKPDSALMANYHSRLAEWVVEDCLPDKCTQASCTDALKRWIWVMNCCKLDGDLLSADAINAALQTTALGRLHLTRLALPVQFYDLLDQNRKFLSNKDTMKEKRCEGFVCVPAMRVYDGLFDAIKGNQGVNAATLPQDYVATETEKYVTELTILQRAAAAIQKKAKQQDKPLNILQRQRINMDEYVPRSHTIESKAAQEEFWSAEVKKLPVNGRLVLICTKREFALKNMPQGFCDKLKAHFDDLIVADYKSGAKKESLLSKLSALNKADGMLDRKKVDEKVLNKINDMFKSIGIVLTKVELVELGNQALYRALLPAEFLNLIGDQFIEAPKEADTYKLVVELNKALHEKYDFEMIKKVEKLVGKLQLKIDQAKLFDCCQNMPKGAELKPGGKL